MVVNKSARFNRAITSGYRLGYVLEGNDVLQMLIALRGKTAVEMRRRKAVPKKSKRKRLSLKRAAKAIAKLISQQEDERERNISQLERAVAKKLRRLTRSK
jgi:hypothetical protein